MSVTVPIGHKLGRSRRDRSCRSLARWLAAALAMVALAGFMSPPARAQVQMGYDAGGMWSVPNYVGPMISGQMFSKSYRECIAAKARGIRTGDCVRSRAGVQRGRQTGPISRNSLVVARDPAISAEVKQRFRERTAKQMAPAAHKRFMAMDWLAIYRREIARPMGLDASNLADIVTGYSVTVWAIVHQQDKLDPAAVAAARDIMRESMTQNAGIARRSTAERQKMAESFIYQTVLAAADRSKIKRTGDPAKAKEASREYRAVGRDILGIDFGKLRLTENGFSE